MPVKSDLKNYKYNFTIFWLSLTFTNKVSLVNSFYVAGSTCPSGTWCDHPSGHVHYNGQHSEVSSSSGLHKGQRAHSVQSDVSGVWPPFWPCPLQWAAFRSLFLQWPAQRSESTQCTVSCMWGVTTLLAMSIVHYNGQHSEVFLQWPTQRSESTQCTISCMWGVTTKDKGLVN